MDREPIAAGRFYAASPDQLQQDVEAYLTDSHSQASANTSERPGPSLLAMAPHAGYPFSGSLAGQTIREAALPDTIFLLGPNHAGHGKGVAVWPGGVWNTPLGSIPVDTKAASCLISHDPVFTPDTEAHLHEHSLEVLLPFLQVHSPDTRIIPVAFKDPSPETLARAGATLAHCLRLHPNSAMLVSSDMSHYISREQARTLDTLALEYIKALDPEGLLQTVREQNISMCGVLPMAAGLIACKLLGARSARITGYTDSGVVTGESEQVVAYAGAIVEQPSASTQAPL